MNAPTPPAIPPAYSLATLARALSVPARWIILRELARGQALPVAELAHRARISPNLTSRHMIALKQLGLAEQVLGRLYRLPATLRPDLAAGLLDLGHCLLRLDPPASV